MQSQEDGDQVPGGKGAAPRKPRKKSFARSRRCKEIRMSPAMRGFPSTQTLSMRCDYTK